MLQSSDQENLLQLFPNIKLSYENLAHKKVYNYDLILAIPEGKKCFAWFTEFNDKNVCIILEIAPNKQIINMKINNVCFSKELSYGTILYGTLFFYKSNNFFSIEDIFYLKGKNIENECWYKKFNYLSELLKFNLKQKSYNKSFIVFGLPLISNCKEDLFNKINNVSYKIDNIQFRSLNRCNNYQYIQLNNFMKLILEENTKSNQIVNNKIVENELPKTISKPAVAKPAFKNQAIFKIKPDIQNDIYYLYCLNDLLEDEFYSIALIPDYKISVFMNGLFRNIKENINLDALEESDDDDEFENDREDKFVYLEKEYKILCVYNYKFKKWVPNKLVDTNSKIILKKYLPNIENK